MELLTSDKALHFLYCFFIAIVSWWFGKFFGINFGWILAIFFAVGKEIKDWYDYGIKLGLKDFMKMSCKDLLADGIGILIAYSILY